jgi:uncharacterized membrane protein
MLCKRCKKKSRWHNAMVLSTTSIMAAVFAVSLVLVDAQSWLPFIGLLISGVWIALFAAANGYMDLDVPEEGDTDVHTRQL